ncbi:Repetin [Streptomyces sp. NPDC089919]|uniref:Repetin n=1 Tax=Streptomyces sp. NPDC089919 TaxID=3155188 RepID=UPI003440DBE6
MKITPADRRTRVAGLCAALLLTAGAAAGSAAAAPDALRPGPAREAAALTGSGKLHRPAGDDLAFSFDAHLAAKDNADPNRATGTFRFSHYKGNWGGSADVKVDCLMTGGPVAVVTGIVTRGDGVMAEAEGRRVGVTVHDDGGHDRLGYSWAAVNDPTAFELPPCTSGAPFETAEPGAGDFRVLPWFPSGRAG